MGGNGLSTDEEEEFKKNLWLKEEKSDAQNTEDKKFLTEQKKELGLAENEGQEEKDCVIF